MIQKQKLKFKSYKLSLVNTSPKVLKKNNKYYIVSYIHSKSENIKKHTKTARKRHLKYKMNRLEE